jgi:acyl-coenzyme A thioesterase PaaI-like protein
MVATLLDGAMTHCLFGRREVAMTADLHVRFRSSVRVNIPATIRAWQVRSRGVMEEVCAELWQEGSLRASARGKFIRTRISQPGQAGESCPPPPAQPAVNQRQP